MVLLANNKASPFEGSEIKFFFSKSSNAISSFLPSELSKFTTSPERSRMSFSK